MPCLLLPLLAFAVAQRADSLAQVSPNVDLLAIHEGSRRTPRHNGQTLEAIAEVGALAEVDLQMRQLPLSGITGVSGDTVYGSLMVVVVAPRRFADDPAAQTSTQGAIKDVAVAWQLEVREVSASLAWLEDFPQAVRVDFQAAFHTLKARQVFTWKVATDGGAWLVDRICNCTPVAFRGRCELPGASLSLIDTATAEAPAAAFRRPTRECRGTVYIMPEGKPQTLLEDKQWREAAAMVIADLAWVSRLEVGTLTAVEAVDTVRLDFWLSSMAVTSCQAAIQRVMKKRRGIAGLASNLTHRWLKGIAEHKDFVTIGRMIVQTTGPESFSGNLSVAKALESALAELALRPAPKASELSFKNVSVTLATAGNSFDAVRVGFRVAFGTPRDRQVFTADFARDGGKRLAKYVNSELPSPWKGRVQLPGWLPGQEKQVATASELGKFQGFFRLWLSWPDLLATDPLVLDAMAMAIGEIASVPQQQVGILVAAEYQRSLYASYWVSSSNATLRQDAVQRVIRAGRWRIVQCTLAQLDRMGHRVQNKFADPADTAFGSFALRVPDVGRFVGSIQVRWAIRSAISRLTGVPEFQARVWVDRDQWPKLPDAVRVNFAVALGKDSLAENFTRAIAGDGGKMLANNINELVRAPFKGQCRFPTLEDVKASMTNASMPSTTSNASTAPYAALANSSNATLHPELGLPHGTMWVYAFFPELFVRKEQEGVAMTIAELAGVPCQQVGIVMTVKSPVLVSIDFWFTMSDARLREAAVQRVSTLWSNEDAVRLSLRATKRKCYTPIFLVPGGTVLKGLERYKCHVPAF